MENLEEFGEYTSWSDRKTFIEERKLVQMAVEDQDTEGIKGYLSPLVKYWWEGYKKHSKNDLTDTEILDIGFLHLDEALKKYYELLEKGKVGYKFSTYFEWFIRQAFVDYLKEEN